MKLVIVLELLSSFVHSYQLTSFYDDKSCASPSLASILISEPSEMPNNSISSVISSSQQICTELKCSMLLQDKMPITRKCLSSVSASAVDETFSQIFKGKDHLVQTYYSDSSCSKFVMASALLADGGIPTDNHQKSN